MHFGNKFKQELPENLPKQLKLIQIRESNAPSILGQKYECKNFRLYKDKTKLRTYMIQYGTIPHGTYFLDVKNEWK